MLVLFIYSMLFFPSSRKVNEGGRVEGTDLVPDCSHICDSLVTMTCDESYTSEKVKSDTTCLLREQVNYHPDGRGLF